VPEPRSCAFALGAVAMLASRRPRESESCRARRLLPLDHLSFDHRAEGAHIGVAPHSRGVAFHRQKDCIATAAFGQWQISETQRGVLKILRGCVRDLVIRVHGEADDGFRIGGYKLHGKVATSADVFELKCKPVARTHTHLGTLANSIAAAPVRFHQRFAIQRDDRDIIDDNIKVPGDSLRGVRRDGQANDHGDRKEECCEGRQISHVHFAGEMNGGRFL
jgi:hypothetical protein